MGFTSEGLSTRQATMRVAVLMGGQSGEHEVSLRSGAAVLEALHTLGHPAFAVTLLRQGGATTASPDGNTRGTSAAGLVALEAWQPDCAFIAMHGPDGEDGRIQGALELLGIPYQGSGIQASAIGLDKIRTKELLRAADLPIAAERVVHASSPSGVATDWSALAPELSGALGLPLVLKTPTSGSSVGVEIVRTTEALAERGAALASEAGRVLVEQFVAGREFTLPVVETCDGFAEAFPVVEIRPKAASFFDYEAKYTPGATDEICPAPIEPALESRLRALGVAAHLALGCSGYSRTDCIVAPDGRIVLLEVNTLPGLTRESLLPKSAAVAGLTFADLVQRLLDRALARAHLADRAAPWRGESGEKP